MEPQYIVPLVPQEPLLEGEARQALEQRQARRAFHPTTWRGRRRSTRVLAVTAGFCIVRAIQGSGSRDAAAAAAATAAASGACEGERRRQLSAAEQVTNFFRPPPPRGPPSLSVPDGDLGPPCESA